MRAEDSDHNTTVERIKTELNTLLAMQAKALDDAIYKGMSRDEAKEYDDRLTQIRKLVAQLARLCEDK